jgi:hypothetical protein
LFAPSLADLLRTLLLDMGHDQTDPVNLE